MKKVQENILFSQYLAMKTETRLHLSSPVGYQRGMCPGFPKELTLLQHRHKLVSLNADTNWFLSSCLWQPAYPWAHCPLPKSLLPSLPEFPRNIWAWCSKLSDTKSGVRSSSSLQITSQLLTALTRTGVFICCSSWLKGSVMPFSFLNLLKFLQQKRAFRAAYMQVMTHEFKVTLPCKPQWN